MRMMKEMVEAAGASGQHVSEKELLNYIIDGLVFSFDFAIGHVSSKLDSLIDHITLVKAKFILQKHEQRIYRNAYCFMNVHDSSANMATRFTEKKHDIWGPKVDNISNNMSLFHAINTSVRSKWLQNTREVGVDNVQNYQTRGRGKVF